MAELKVSTEADNTDTTLEPSMGKAGIYIFTDRMIQKRKQEFGEYFKDSISEDEVKDFDISKKRQWVLDRSNELLEFVNKQGMEGQGGDKAKFYKAMGAARNQLQRNIEDLLFSESDDRDVIPTCLDRISQVEKLPMATFRRDNTSILKAFTATGMMQAGNKPIQSTSSLGDSPKPEDTPMSRTSTS